MLKMTYFAQKDVNCSNCRYFSNFSKCIRSHPAPDIRILRLFASLRPSAAREEVTQRFAKGIAESRKNDAEVRQGSRSIAETDALKGFGPAAEANYDFFKTEVY
jgi:hypothetical protein